MPDSAWPTHGRARGRLRPSCASLRASGAPQVNEVIAEKAMLQGIQSDFCIQLVATAQDSRNLYMMMDPLLGRLEGWHGT